MTLKSIAAVLAITVLPLATPAQAAASKAEAQKVVKIISSDQAKLKAYCEMSKLGAQADEADKKKDTKTVEALGKRMDALSDQLGPEYAKLMEGLDGMKQDSKQAQEVGAVIEGLDKLCGK